MAIEKWPTVRTRDLGDFRIFKLREDTCTSPRTGRDHDLVVIDAPDWVNVIALTPAGGVVLIRQYRFGTRIVALELPGGVIDPGEAPADAAVRELHEETGYVSERWTALGSIEPNPAIQNNRCHTFLAEGCRLAGPAAQTDSEDIGVEERPLAEVPALIGDGSITHALVVVAFHKLALLREGLLHAAAPAGR